MKVLVDSEEDIIEKDTDSRGRFTLGMEYSNSKVTLAILNVEEDDNIED